MCACASGEYPNAKLAAERRPALLPELRFAAVTGATALTARSPVSRANPFSSPPASQPALPVAHSCLVQHLKFPQKTAVPLF